MLTAFELSDLNDQLIHQARLENMESGFLNDQLAAHWRPLAAGEVIMTMRFARFFCAFDVAFRVCLEHTTDKFVAKYQSMIREYWPDGPYCQVFIDPRRTDLSFARELLFSNPLSGYLALDRAFVALDTGYQDVALANSVPRMKELLRRIGEEHGYSKAKDESTPEPMGIVSQPTTERS